MRFAPFPGLLVVGFQELGGISRDDAKGRKALGDNRVGSHHAVAPYPELSVIADDHGAVPQPAIPLDHYFPTFGHTLRMNRKRCVVEFMIVIHDQHGWRQQNIRLEKDLISAGYARSSADLATRAK